MQTIGVMLAGITVPAGRTLRASTLELQQSLREVGLLQPILLTETHVLIAGYHRLEAARSLGWDRIDARICQTDELHTRLMTIDENLMRHQLSALEEGEQLAARKEIYEALHPETRQGGDRKSVAPRSKRQNAVLISGNESIAPDDGPVKPAPVFTEDVAARFGKSRSTVERSVRIGRDIAPEVREEIRGTAIEQKKEALLAIAAEKTPEEQRRRLHLLQDDSAPLVSAVAGSVPADGPARMGGRAWAERLAVVNRAVLELDVPQGRESVVRKWGAELRQRNLHALRIQVERLQVWVHAIEYVNAEVERKEAKGS